MQNSTTRIMKGLLAVVSFFFVLHPFPLQAQLPSNAFIAQAPYNGVGTDLSAIIAVDLNNDHLPELAVTNRTTGIVTILQNDGDGTFSNPLTRVTGGQEPVAMAAGNFNAQDTIQDLIFANIGDNAISILLDNGSSPTPVTGNTDGPIAIATGYFNSDNILDFAVANYTDPTPSVTISFGDGDGTFTTLSNRIDVGPTDCCVFPRDLVAADVDGDGDTDLAVAMVGNFSIGKEWPDNIAILLNDGNGVFEEVEGSGNQLRVFLPIEDDTCDRDDFCHFLAITTADINGDGLADLAVAVSEEENLPNRSIVIVLLNRGIHPTNGRWLGFGMPQLVSLPDGADPRAIAIVDVDGDGAPDLITANRGTSDVSVSLNNGTGTFGAIRSFDVSDTNPVVPDTNPRAPLAVADLNGDCAVDIAVANENSTVTVLINQILPQACPSHDVNGDSKADLIWRNDTTGRVNLWLLDGTRLIDVGSPGTVADQQWQIVGIGDTDDNRTADLIWRNSATGRVNIWLLNGTTRMDVGSPGTVPNLQWQVVGVGDTNCDRKADLIWYNNTTGSVSIWLLDGLTRIGGPGSPGTMSNPAWQIVGIGDVNNDCAADIVWRHSTTGQVHIWLLDGTTLLDQDSPGIVGSASWQIIGVADTDGDHKADIIWHNSTTGEARVWRLDGLTRLSNLSPGAAATAWRIANVIDTNGDGKADIVWRHSINGRVVVWLLNGATQIGSGSPGQVTDLNWEIQ